MADPRSRARRLLTLTGVVPLGVFLIEHLLANASAMAGAARFDVVVGAAARSPLTTAIELCLVVLPLLVHAAIGVSLIVRPDPEAHTYGSDRLYKLQRFTGVVMALFVIGHLLELRVRRWLYGLAVASIHTRLSEDLSTTWNGIPWVALAYVVGVGAATFHFVNGAWAYLASRGPRPPRSTTYGLVLLGSALFLVGTATAVSVATGSRLLPGPEAGTSPRCGPDTVPSAAVSAPSR
jgi:succinate dehydrogenase / fumarate reductase, cytochrome b subunit